MTAPHTTLVLPIRAATIYQAHCDTCGAPVGDETTDRSTAEAQARWHRWRHGQGAS